MAHYKYMGIANGLHKYKITYRDPKKSNKKDKRSHETIKVEKKSDIHEVMKGYQAIEDGVILQKNFAEVAEEWLEKYAKTRYRTYDEQERYLNKRILPFFGEKDIANITPQEIDTVLHLVRTKRADGKTGNNSESTVKQVYNLLNQIFKKAMEWRYIKDNPMNHIIKPIVKPKIVELMPVEKWEPYWNSVFNALTTDSDYQFYLLIRLTLETGMRQGEVTALMWDCVDFSNDYIHIDKAFSKTGSLGLPKNGDIRDIQITNQLMSELEQYKKDTDMFRIDTEFDFVFIADKRDARPYKNHSLYTKWRRLIKRNNLEKIRYHDIRHYSASLLFLNMDAKEDFELRSEDISRRLGHATPDFTRRFYIKYLPKKDDHASTSMFGKMFDNMDYNKEKDE